MIIFFLIAVFLAVRYIKLKKRKVVYSAPVPVLAPGDLLRIAQERERAEKEREREAKQAEREKAAQEKKEAAIAQAQADIAYYKKRLKSLYVQLAAAQDELYMAKQNCEYDATMNQRWVVVTEPTVKRHIDERDKALKKVMTIETHIHTAEKNLFKAQRISRG